MRACSDLSGRSDTAERPWLPAVLHQQRHVARSTLAMLGKHLALPHPGTFRRTEPLLANRDVTANSGVHRCMLRLDTPAYRCAKL